MQLPAASITAVHISSCSRPPSSWYLMAFYNEVHCATTSNAGCPSSKGCSCMQRNDCQLKTPINRLLTTCATPGPWDAHSKRFYHKHRLQCVTGSLPCMMFVEFLLLNFAVSPFQPEHTSLHYGSCEHHPLAALIALPMCQFLALSIS
jgi:hypothetical protein